MAADSKIFVHARLTQSLMHACLQLWYSHTASPASARLFMLGGPSSSNRAHKRWSSKPQYIVLKGSRYVGFAKNRISLNFACIQFLSDQLLLVQG